MRTKKKLSNSIKHDPSCSTIINQSLNVANKNSTNLIDSNDGLWGFLPSPSTMIIDASPPTVQEETTKMNDEAPPPRSPSPVQIFTEPKILIRKIRFDDPSHYPIGVPYVLVKELIEEYHPSLRYKMMRKRRRRVSSHEEYQEEVEEEEEDDDDDGEQTRRKRIHRFNANQPDPIGTLTKKSRDRFARRILEIEENPEENSSFQRFQYLLETFDDDFERYRDELDEHHLDLLLPQSTLEEMSELAEKLKLSTYFTSIDRVKLRRLIEILSLRIEQGIEINPLLQHENSDDEQTWRQLIFERLTNCANACDIALNIMTTTNMSKEILMEKAIESSTLFIKGQLVRTIFPEFDPLYRNENQSKDSQLIKQKRSKSTASQCKQVQILYNKIVSLFQGIADLLTLGKFTDTIILAISSFTVSCIFVENIFDLQALSLNILSQIFARYEHHRDSILDDLLLSLNRLPTSKKSLRCYRLPSGDFIQMFSALIMQLIHSPVSTKSNDVQDAANELGILATYSTAQNFAFKFLTLFFRSCGMKHGEEDYRRIFENYLDDLLITANRPEWPAAEILLTLLSRILMMNFSNQNLPLPVRLQSLDYLGSVAAQLRKDSMDIHVLNLRENQLRLERIVEKILNGLDFDDETKKIYRTDSFKYQRCLMIYLNELAQYDSSIEFAKMFHLGQWIRDVCLTIERLTQALTRERKPLKIDFTDDEIEESTMKSQTSINDEIEKKKLEKIQLMKLLKLPIQARPQCRHPFDVDDDELCLLMRYLTSHRPFLKTFDIYLKQLAAIFQSESGSHLRSKAMKCLCTVVETDPTVLGRNDIKSCVQVGLTDKSISVREAAIDLIGRYIVNKQQLILQYYDVLCERSIDTGVSVRKRVVKIFRDICLSQPDFVRLPDICSRLLRRIHDEESIKKFVLETFQQLWFVPTKDVNELRHRVQTIIDILIDGQKQNHIWLENLIKEFLQINEKQTNEEKKKIREQRDEILQSIRTLINELIESILKIEAANDHISSNKMVATFIALYALGKANPSNILPHFSTIVEYLNIKCTSYNDNVIVQYVAKILEFTVPLMRSASSSIIYSLEGSLTKLLLVSGQLVIHSSIACLAAVIRLSKNYALVKEVFQRYHSYVVQCREKLKKKCSEPLKTNAQLARSIYIIGVLCKYFDLEKSTYADLCFSSDDLFQLFLYFIHRSDSLVKLKSLVALGYFLQRYGHFLVDEPIRELYHAYLLDRRASAGQLRCQVLINLEEYFRDCIRRMAEYDVDYLQNDDEISRGENLKETSDVHSEMASSIAQCYLRIVLETYLTNDEIIRQCVRKVVTCILEQGLVHPVQFIPYLIAMTTDHDITIQQTAEQNLQDLDKTNPGIIQTKVIQGLKMSYQLQKLLNSSKISHRSEIIRGMTKLLVTSYTHQQLPFCSVNHYLYSLIRSSRVYRRALINHLIKMFDNETSQLSLEEQLYIADNLAYFPYQVQDEPLFLVEQIDLTVSVAGSTQLFQLREILKEKFSFIDDDETNDPLKFEESFSSVTNDDDIRLFEESLRQAKPTLLLLLLKSYLKEVYFLDETKINEYDHSESSKILDRPILTRQLNIKFDPKIILETIKGQPKFYDRNEKNQRIIYEFLEFKRHLLAFDNDMEETLHSITELLPTSTKTKKTNRTSSKRRKVMIDSDDEECL